MSLVNDALKRATEAQKKSSPAPAVQLQLRPIEPAPHEKHGHSLVVPATLLTIGAAAIISLTLFQRERLAAVAPAPAPTPTVSPQSHPVEVAQTPAVEKASAETAIRSAPAPAPVVVPDPPAPEAQAAPPPPPPLKLQAVFFNPSRPSAIISGKTVFVGDKVREMKVVAIGSASAMLVGSSETNLLTLE